MTERNFQSWHPVLGVQSMAKAIDYYVDWLGFQLDGEWEEAPGEPKIAWISRLTASRSRSTRIPTRRRTSG